MIWLTHGVDIGILLIIALSLLIGIFRGFTRELLGIAGWIGAFATVFYGLPLFRPLGRLYIHNPMVADGVLGGILFILSLAVFILISRGISSTIKGSLFNGLDRSLGMVFGFIRGLFLVCLLYLVFSFVSPTLFLSLAFRDSHLLPWIEQGAHILTYLIPEDYLPQRDTLEELMEREGENSADVSLEGVEETVKNLSTLKPMSPPKTLNRLLERYDTSSED